MRAPLMRRFIPWSLGLLVTVGTAFPQNKDEMLRQIIGMMHGLQSDVTKLVAEQDTLKQSIQALEARLNDESVQTSELLRDIEKSFNRQQEGVVSPVSQTAAKVDQLSSQFAGLRDAVEESNSMVARLQTEIADIKTHLTTLPPPGMGGPGGVPPADGDLFGQVGAAEALFNNAYSDYTRGDYDLAVAEFQDFLKNWGTNPRAPEAQYYLGQIYYNQSDFARAAQQYDLVLERYPVGVVSADAQYKKAMAFKRMGRLEDARREFQSVLDSFGTSGVAPAARAELEDLQASDRKPSPLRP